MVENTQKDVVKYSFNVSENAEAASDGKTNMISVTFDFTGVSREQLKALAIRNMAITLQSKMRSATTRKTDRQKWSDVVKAYNGLNVNVLDALGNSRTRLTPEARIAKVAEGKSVDDLKAMIALLQAQVAANAKAPATTAKK